MPLSKHYKGKGLSVMRDMTDRYGQEKGERVFYATEQEQKKRAMLPTTKRRRKKQ